MPTPELHYCCTPGCPGLPWRASDARHPCVHPDACDGYTREGVPVARCGACNGYGTSDGQPARDLDRSQRACRTCAGTGEDLAGLMAAFPHTAPWTFRQFVDLCRYQRAEFGEAAVLRDLAAGGKAAACLRSALIQGVANLDAEADDLAARG